MTNSSDIQLGTISGVGVGPGDPGLLTLSAVEALRDAALVVAPVSRAESASIALAIARPHVPASAELAELEFPMSRDAEERRAAARRAADVLAEASRDGRSAVFLTLGDSTLYSTWGYVRDELAAAHPDVPVVTIPGVTTASAAAARLGVSLAEGDEPLLIWPKEPLADLGDLLDVAPSIVVLKGGRRVSEVIAAAESASDATVSGVRRCGMPDEVLAPDARALIELEPDYLTALIVHRRKETTDAE